MMRQIIAGGTVYDGRGNPPLSADVLIENGAIQAVGPRIHAPGAERMDAAGRVVAPGFIDMHRHCDVAAIHDPGFGALELSQGITAAVMGNCGLAPAPCPPEREKALSDFLAPVTGEWTPGTGYAHYAPYLDALRGAKPPLHLGFLAATGAIKMAVKGFSKTPYTKAEMDRAQGLLREAMQAGAVGASIGVMYQPECYSTKEEMARLLSVAAPYSGLLCAHIRGEGDTLADSVREAAAIARAAGLRLNISHFKATGIRNWGRKIHEAIACIEKARAEGLEVTVDFYPYDGGATTLLSVLPPEVLQGEGEVDVSGLSTAAGKRRVREALQKPHPGWENMAESIGWDRIVIGSVSLPAHGSWQGKDVAAIARAQGYDDPADCVCDLLAAEKGKVGVILRSVSPGDVDEIARLPYAAVISDALYGGGGNPHPRLYGAFPKVIRDLVVERGVLSMEEALHKMTGMPAGRLGIADRGIIAPGYRADLVMFAPESLRDHATFEDSRRLTTGMEAVWVEGALAFAKGRPTGERAGTLLLRT